MEIEQFTVPFDLENLAQNTDGNPDTLKRELKSYNRAKCRKIFSDSDSFSFIAWAISQCKNSDAHCLLLSDVLEEICTDAFNRLKDFFRDEARDQTEMEDLVNYKKAACLSLYFLKVTLKGTKSNIMQSDENKRGRNKPTEPLIAKQLSLMTFLSKSVDSFGSDEQFSGIELGPHLLEIGFKFLKCGIVYEPVAIEHLSKLLRNLIAFSLVNGHEFRAKFMNLLEDGTEDGASFAGRFMATLLPNGRKNLSEFAHEIVMRTVELLLTRKYSESPIYKNARDFLLELVSKDPLYFYNNFPIFAVLLGCENYHLRTFVCEAMYQSSKFLKDKASSDSAIQDKILKFFEIVCERSRDKSSYARSAILNCISDFVNLEVLDEEALNEVFRIACERMADASSMVRKRALILLQELCLYFKQILPSKEALQADLAKYQKRGDRNNLKIDSDENGHIYKSKYKSARILDELSQESERIYSNEIRDEKSGSKSRRRPKKRLAVVDSPAMQHVNILDELASGQKKDREVVKDEDEDSIPYQSQDDPQHRKLKLFEAVYSYIENSMPIIRTLAFSRNTSDMIESLRLIFVLTQMDIDNVRALFLECFKLVWIKEVQIRDELLLIFHRAFISKNPADIVIENLINVINQSDLNSRISAEEILNLLLKRDIDEKEGRGVFGPTKLQISIKKNLWDNFIASYRNPDLQTKCSLILRLLKLCIVHYPLWIIENVEPIFETIKIMMANNYNNFAVLTEFASIMIHLVSENNDLKDVIVKSLMYFALKYQGVNDPYYSHFLEKLVLIIFMFKKNPEVVSDYLIKRMASFLTNEGITVQSQQMFENVDSYMNIQLTQAVGQGNIRESEAIAHRNKLVHLLLAVGNIALKFLYYFEKVDAILQNRKSNLQNNQAQNELEQAIGGAEAEYEAQKEALTNLIDKNMFRNSLLACFIPILVYIIKAELELVEKSNNQETKNRGDMIIESPTPEFSQNSLGRLEVEEDNKFRSKSQPTFFKKNPGFYSQGLDYIDSHHIGVPSEITDGLFRTSDTVNVLAVAALDALSKYMMVSSSLCREYLGLVFATVETPGICPSFASNAIIYLGDLFHKHPNFLNAHMLRLFNCLKSKSSMIRRTAVTVLSHLILNDFVKLKAEIADFVFLLDDESPQIVEIANLFFHQLSEKDSKFIFNILPDAISRLSQPEDKEGVSEQEFERFAKFFLRFIQKEKVVENVIDKLLTRVKGNQNPREVRNVVYCLFCLANNDRGLQKLNEHAESLRIASEIGDVSQILKNMIYKLRKNNKVNKQILDELEGVLFQSSEAVFNELKKRKMDKRQKRGRKPKPPEN
jgi:hypothetical protein